MISVKEKETDECTNVKHVELLLSRIQRELKVPKDLYNSFSKYKYRSTEKILEAVKKLLPEGASLIIEDEVRAVGKGISQRFYIRATVSLKYKGDSISVRGFARESLDKKGMDDSQITGATSSYARKYALNGMFCIDDSKDADDMDNRDHGTKEANKPVSYLYNPPSAGVGGSDVTKLLGLINELQVPEEVVKKWLAKEGSSSVYHFSEEQYGRYIQFLETKKGAR